MAIVWRPVCISALIFLKDTGEWRNGRPRTKLEQGRKMQERKDMEVLQVDSLSEQIKQKRK